MHIDMFFCIDVVSFTSTYIEKKKLNRYIIITIIAIPFIKHVKAKMFQYGLRIGYY